MNTTLKKKIFKIIALLAVCFSCQNNNVPDGVIAKDKMTKILIEIHNLEAKIAVQNMPADSSKMYYYKLQGEIFKSYQTDSSQFNKSFKYYLGQGTAFDNIYAAVVDSLSLQEAKK